jgi:CHAD domain-containing protein
MPYRFLASETVQDGLARSAGEQVDRAVREIQDEGLDRHQAVHQVRKRCKKIRGLLRLCRGAMPKQVFRTENAWYRDTARILSDARDSTALLETYDHLMETCAERVDRRAFAPVRRKLTLRRREVTDGGDRIEEQLAQALSRLQEGGTRIASWSLAANGFDALAGGLKKTYRRARKAMRKAREEPSVERLHEWRKRAKYHRYHNRLLRDLWRPVMAARRGELHKLSDHLGEDHNLAIFRETLVKEAERFEGVSGLEDLLALVDECRDELQAKAWLQGRRVLAEKPKHLVRRVRAYWDAWRAEHKAQGDEQ